MNEQYCIDWINSLDISEALFIDRIEDLYKDNNILLNIICKVLNKNLEELLNILGASISENFLENISSIMNLYFDYQYDYTNKENLNKNTILLIRFLKTRYPKEIKNNDNFKDNEINNKNSEYYNKIKAANNINNDITNYNQKKSRSNNNRNNNIKQNNNMQLNKYKEKLKTYNGPLQNINNYQDFNFKTTPNRSTYIENNSSNNNKIIKINEIKKDNSSFFKEITNLFPNQIYKSNKIQKNQSQKISLKDMPKSTNTKNSKSLSSKKINKHKKSIKTETNYISENFIKKVMTSKIPNYFLKTLGKPILKKDDYFYYYQFPKFTSPVTQISIEPINKYKQITKNNYYKFPFLLQNLMNQKNKIQNESNLNKNIIRQKKEYNHNINISELEKKERLILNYLNQKGIINIEQKNSDYLWTIFIPDLKDGYIIGKIINLLEKKNKNYLKGISKETFYKINIYYNWQNIIEFLINKNTFNSIYLYQKNFYSNDNKLFNFLYDLLKFYYDKENLNKNKFQNYNQKSDINISNIPNISTHNLINNSNISKNISNLIDKSKSNNSFNSIPIPKNNKIHKKIKINRNSQGRDFQMNSLPSISEIMNIRKSINYVHRGNNSLVLFSNKDKINENRNKNDLNKSEDYIYLKNKEKFYIKGENISFDKNVNNIISFLNLIGINTSQINFYLPELKIFKDGILLYQIISQLESNFKLLPKIDYNPKNPSTAINNHRLIINYLNKYKKNFPVELTGKEKELYKSNPKFVLKFLNVLRNIYNNEVYYYEKLNIKNKLNDKNQIIGKKIYPKNIDKSERIALPLSQELRDKFLIKGNAQVWA